MGSDACWKNVAGCWCPNGRQWGSPSPSPHCCQSSLHPAQYWRRGVIEVDVQNHDGEVGEAWGNVLLGENTSFPALNLSLGMNEVILEEKCRSCTWTWSRHGCAWTRPTSSGRNQNQDTCRQGLLSLTVKSWLTCSNISPFQMCSISENQICISVKSSFSDFQKSSIRFRTTWIGCEFGHKMVPPSICK